MINRNVIYIYIISIIQIWFHYTFGASEGGLKGGDIPLAVGEARKI